MFQLWDTVSWPHWNTRSVYRLS